MKTLVNLHSASVFYKRLSDLATGASNCIYPLKDGTVMVKDAGGKMHTVLWAPEPFSANVNVLEKAFSIVMTQQSESNQSVVAKLVRLVS